MARHVQAGRACRNLTVASPSPNNFLAFEEVHNAAQRPPKRKWCDNVGMDSLHKLYNFLKSSLSPP